MRWPVRLGLLSSVWAPARDRQSLCHQRHSLLPRAGCLPRPLPIVCGRPGGCFIGARPATSGGGAELRPVPDKLKLDWCRFLKGGGWCLEGEDLAEGAGVAYLGVAGTSYTGPSYMPLGTPCNPET